MVKKLSAHEARARLALIGVLIVDNDARISTIVRDVLKSLGFVNIHLARNGKKALEIIEDEKINMIITDWRVEPLDGINLAQYLRTANDSPNRFIPIIMLTGNAEKIHVETARDAGVTEFLVKPFSARTLCDRIVRIIENPRSFVVTKVYVGPDRRRRAISPPDGTDKRKKQKRKLL